MNVNEPIKINKPKNLGKYILIFVVIVLVLIVLVNCITVIPEGFIGVKYNLGKIRNSSLQPGAHFSLPFIEAIEKVDIREHVYETHQPAYTKDTQTVESIYVKVNYVYATGQIDSLIRTVGVGNVESTLIVPNLNSILKNTIGKYKAEELIQNRSIAQELVEDELREALNPYGVTITAVNLADIDFEDSFEQTIRDKVAAEQEALRVRNETAAKEEEARQKVIGAQAEADSKKLTADAEAYAISVIQAELSKSPEYIELQKIEKWNGEFPTVMGTTVNPFVTLNPWNSADEPAE
ncbi:MAG: prohibitin family protein [Ruminococcaceae bacterium]|jgi:regulator of protease activity HflC (stomatin/prohibitin superfamily)|nr:prohibitin family protein [Oscillospiraceae bacterium]